MDLRYQEEGREYAPAAQQRVRSRMIAWVLRTGFAKNQRDAEYILLTVAGICVLVAGYLFWPNPEPVRVDPSNGTDNNTAIIQVK